jgi:hypothetical protein
MWSKRILILGATVVGAAAVTVGPQAAAPAYAEPCAPAVVPAPGCDAPAPPPPNGVGEPVSGAPACDTLDAVFSDPACRASNSSGGT